MATEKRNPYKGKTRGQDEELAAVLGERTRKEGLQADWADVSHDTLFNIIWATDQLSGSVTFSTTRNGNAFVIRLYVGTPYQPRYFDGDEEGRAQMADFAEQLMSYALKAG